MSESPTPARRGPSPWWALLLLPLGLAAGWGIGQLPGPAPDARVAALRTVGPATGAPVVPPPDRSAPADPSPPPGAPAEYSEWTTLENALAESGRNGKPVLLDFNAEWCGPCRAMKHQVFEDPLRGQAVQGAVIPVSIVDRRREDGGNRPWVDELQRRFEVDAFPTLVVFSPAGGKALRTKGFGGADETVEWIIRAAKASR